jgi:hypothetical protein
MGGQGQVAVVMMTRRMLEEEEGQTDNEEPEEGSAGAAGSSSVQVGNGTVSFAILEFAENEQGKKLTR